MQGYRKLYHTQIGSHVTACVTQLFNEHGSHFISQCGKLADIQTLQIFRVVYSFQHVKPLSDDR